MLLIYIFIGINFDQTIPKKNTYTTLLQNIQDELVFGNCNFRKYNSNLETIVSHPAPTSEPEKSAFFLLKKAQADFRKIEDMAINNKAKYLELMNLLISFNYGDFLTSLSSSISVRQGLLLIKYDENVQKIRLFLGERSFTEFIFRRSLLLIRSEENTIAHENLIKSTNEISKAFDGFFEDPEWNKNIFFNILIPYLCTAPISKIPTDHNYLNSLNKLNCLLEIRHNNQLKVQCIIGYRKMHYHFNNGNLKDAIAIFKTLPTDFYEDKKNIEAINPLLFVDILNLASEVYWENGNKELAKVYQEISYTICSTKTNNEKGFAKKRTLLVAEKLRSYYLKDKNLNLIRSLEARAEKYGMTPIPKQEGEN